MAGGPPTPVKPSARWCCAGPIRAWSEDTRDSLAVSHTARDRPSPSIFRGSFCAANKSMSCSRFLSKRISCKTSLKNWVEVVKTKLSCETSLKNWKLKLWRRSFLAGLPSKSESWRCENEALVRDAPQKVKVEDVKTKLLCETSLKNW